MNKIELKVSANDIEACHWIGKSKNKSKKTIIIFVNRKFTQKLLLNRIELRSINPSSLGLGNCNIFINENLASAKKISLHCRKLKGTNYLDKSYTRDGVVHFAKANESNGKPFEITHKSTLTDLFPDFNFGEDTREDEQNASVQSSN